MRSFRSRGHTGHGGAASFGPAEESEPSRDEEPWLGEVGEIGDPTQWTVQPRRMHLRHGAVEAAEPSENPHRT